MDSESDFFISYTQDDRAWAEWIAWVLEEDGHRVLIQAWDFVPGSNWMASMQAGTRDAARTIAVLSDAYLRSVFGGAEWQAAMARDPDGTGRKLLVVRVADCERPGLLAGVVGVDLFGMPEEEARGRLRTMVAAAESGRAKPAVAPGFPGAPPGRAVPSEPDFPGERDAPAEAGHSATGTAADGAPHARAEESSRLRQPVAKDRWRSTLDGFEAASVMRLMQVIMSHRGYMRPTGTEPPSVRVGLAVACEPVSPAAGASGMRARFVEFLRTGPVMNVITSLVSPDGDASWSRQAGNGPANLEAALTRPAAGQEEAPIAAAKLLLPRTGSHPFGGDSRRAVLILHIEWRTQEGTPAAPADLATWSRAFARSLAMANALASFLSHDLGLGDAHDIPYQAGIWLRSNGLLTELVDVGDLVQLPGATPSNEISLYAVTDPAGKPAEHAASELVSQLCEYGLHVDGYEQAVHVTASSGGSSSQGAPDPSELA